VLRLRGDDDETLAGTLQEKAMALMRREESQAPTNAVPAGSPHTVLGAEAAFDGKLVFSGSVRIDGKFTGEIATDDVLLVSETAEVIASLNVGALVLNGTLRGNVRAKRVVELHAPARLYGDIETPSLVIHHGVMFEGHCKMENLQPPRPELVKTERK
jgi:cytoskeletal protein CcmA (bactofilin family)